MNFFERIAGQTHWKHTQKSDRWKRSFPRPHFGAIPPFWRLVLCAVTTFGASAVAEITVDAPISGTDVQEITRVLGAVTDKPILFIMGVTQDRYVPGAVVTGKAWMENVSTGEKTLQYTRTDLVSVWMKFADREHVDIYTVRKMHDRWKIEGKKDWALP